MPVPKFSQETENNPIQKSIKNNKIFEINLTKKVEDLCTKNYKTLMTEDNTINGKQFHGLCIKIINIVKVFILSQNICRFIKSLPKDSRNPCKIPMAFFFTETKKS